MTQSRDRNQDSIVPAAGRTLFGCLLACGMAIVLGAGTPASTQEPELAQPAPAEPAAEPARTGPTDPEAWVAEAPETYRARFDCSNGSFVVEVTRSLSPLGADRFYNLVQSGFFDGARFFRVLPGFIVQFGLNGLPAVDQAWFRGRIRDDQIKGSNTVGTITFAMSGPNSRTTQIFINLGENARLDAMGFSPFGRVVEGMDVVAAIEPQYREQPNQGLIRSQGNDYLQQQFPELDFVRNATIVGAAPTLREAPAIR